MHPYTSEACKGAWQRRLVNGRKLSSLPCNAPRKTLSSRTPQKNPETAKEPLNPRIPRSPLNSLPSPPEFCRISPEHPKLRSFLPFSVCSPLPLYKTHPGNPGQARSGEESCTKAPRVQGTSALTSKAPGLAPTRRCSGAPRVGLSSRSERVTSTLQRALSSFFATGGGFPKARGLRCQSFQTQVELSPAAIRKYFPGALKRQHDDSCQIVESCPRFWGASR